MAEKLPTINEIFEERKKYIPEVGEQLKKRKSVKVEIARNKDVNIDYREISVSEKEGEGKPVLLLPGFGSGWEGISELGFSLACEGRKVIMPSLPGYGNSDNPLREYYDADNFENEAMAVNSFLKKINLSDKVHLIGHSMGSEIVASLAEQHPEKVASLVLLNPAGIREKENLLKLITSFILSGAMTKAEFALKNYFSGERDYQKELWKYIPETKSPFAKDRIPQRLAEIRKISHGRLWSKLRKIKNIPVTYISGELDTVCSVGSKKEIELRLDEILENKSNLKISVMKSLRHNITVAPDEITATNIEHYLEIAEKKK